MWRVTEWVCSHYLDRELLFKSPSPFSWLWLRVLSDSADSQLLCLRLFFWKWCKQLWDSLIKKRGKKKLFGNKIHYFYTCCSYFGTIRYHKLPPAFWQRCCLIQTAWFIAVGVCWRYWLVFPYSQLGTTALMVASYYGHIDCVRELVLQGADINLQREVGFKQGLLKWLLVCYK